MYKIRTLLVVVPAFPPSFSAKMSTETMFIPCAIIVSSLFFEGLIGPFWRTEHSNNYLKYIILSYVRKGTLLVIVPTCPPLFITKMTPK